MSYQGDTSFGGNLQDSFMGGGQHQQEYEDFLNRYDQGHPSEGYDDDEVTSRYQQVSQHLSSQQYQEAAHESFGRMSPDERVQFGQSLQQQARSQGINDPAWDEDDNQYQDPGYLSQVTSRLEQQQPGTLGRVLSGGGSTLGNPTAKAGLAGITAAAARRLMGRS